MKKVQKQQMGELLKDPTLQVSKARNPLAVIYRQILLETRMNSMKWNQLMTRYINDPRNGIPDNNTKRHQARNNLNRQLAAPRLSFKTIMRGFRVLFPLEIEMSFKINWGFRTTKHAIVIYKRAGESGIATVETAEEMEDLFVDDDVDQTEEDTDA